MFFYTENSCKKVHETQKFMANYKICSTVETTKLMRLLNCDFGIKWLHNIALPISPIPPHPPFKPGRILLKNFYLWTKMF